MKKYGSTLMMEKLADKYRICSKTTGIVEYGHLTFNHFFEVLTGYDELCVDIQDDHDFESMKIQYYFEIQTNPDWKQETVTLINSRSGQRYQYFEEKDLGQAVQDLIQLEKKLNENILGKRQ